MKFRFIQSLDLNERKKLETIEKNFDKNSDNKNKIAYLYDKYTENIMDLLQEYGYLIPLKKDHTRIS